MTTEEKWHEVKFADGINNNIVAMDEGGRILLADKEARADIAALKQEMADLRKIVAEWHMEVMSQRGLWNSWARMAMPGAQGE